MRIRQHVRSINFSDLQLDQGDGADGAQGGEGEEGAEGGANGSEEASDLPRGEGDKGEMKEGLPLWAWRRAFPLSTLRILQAPSHTSASSTPASSRRGRGRGSTRAPSSPVPSSDSTCSSRPGIVESLRRAGTGALGLGPRKASQRLRGVMRLKSGTAATHSSSIRRSVSRPTAGAPGVPGPAAPEAPARP